STPWGATPMNALKENRDEQLLKRIKRGPITIPRQPEVFIQITVPSEFQRMGKVNIGITAGIETTLISQKWIEGCNRMDTVWAISNHSVNVIKDTQVAMKNQMGQTVQVLKVDKPVELLHNCIHTDIFRKLSSSEVL